MSLPVTIYERPFGKQTEIICKNIREDDAHFLKTRSVKVSMEEDVAGGQIVYADYGAQDEDGQPEEIIVFSKGRSCEDTMSELRERVERAMATPRRGI